MVAGFEQPTSGQILIDGVDMAGRPPYLRPVNTVFQQYALFPHLSVFENVAFGLKVKKTPADEVKTRVQKALEMLRLTGLERRKPAQLSGGQQQRVALARALVCAPKVLLLDEPLGALDLKLRQQIQLEIKQLQRELGITFIYVTHDQDEALAMSDRVVIMRSGRIEQVGTPKEIYDAPATRFVATFVGETNVFEGKALASGYGQAALDWHGRTLVGRMPVRPINPGNVAAMIVRPEDVHLQRLDASSDVSVDQQNDFIGTVIEEVYGGSHVRVVVQLMNSTKLYVRMGREQAGYYPVGTRVRATWPEGSPILVAGD